MRNLILACAIVLAGPLLMGVTSAAAAQDVNRCIDRCFGNFSPMQDGGSTELRDECLQQCKQSAAPVTPHGAIAFDPGSAGWGIAYGMANDGNAIRAAMAQCRQHGSNCQVAASYTNTCAAVATVRAKAKFVTAQNSNLAQARANAMKMCTSQLGAGCQIWVFTCAWDTK